MIGNALTPEKRESTIQARAVLLFMKEVKLRARAAKYENQNADLAGLIGHLRNETKEAIEAANIDYIALAFEIADIANCCDLIIAEIMPGVDSTLMEYYC